MISPLPKWLLTERRTSFPSKRYQEQKSERPQCSLSTVDISFYIYNGNTLNPLILMGDQNRISPYNIDTISSDENKEKYQLGDY